MTTLSDVNPRKDLNLYIKLGITHAPLALIVLFVFFNGEFGNRPPHDSTFFGFLVVLIGALFWLFLSNYPQRITPNYQRIPVIITLLMIILIPYFFERWWWDEFGGALPTYPDYRKFLDFILSLVILLIISYIFFEDKPKLFINIRFPILILLAFLIKLETIEVFPNPRIDVWHVLMSGPDALLKLKNPYSIVFPDIYPYTVDYFPYPPGILLILIPVRAMNLEVRYFFLAIEILLALFIYLITGYRRISELYALFFLFIPCSFFFLHYAFTESLSLFFIALLIFLCDRSAAEKWRPFLFAFTAAIKQSIWVLIPFYGLFLIKKGRTGIKEIIIALMAFIAIVLPFFLWSPDDFIYDIWTFHSKQDRVQSMTINNFLSHNPSYITKVPIISFLIPYCVLLILFFFWDRIKSTPLYWAQVFQFGFFAGFLFFLWGNLAFMNHYYLIISGFYFLYLKFQIQSLESRTSIKSE